MSKKNVKPIPAGYHAVTPYITVKSAAEAIDFYREAFGAEELFRLPCPRGTILHAEIKVGDSIVMLNDENLDHGARSPESLGGSAGAIMLYVEDVDAVFDRAVKAGASPKQPVTDMFWGDRYGRVTDPFGHDWSIATHIEDVSPEEMGARASKFFAAQSA